MSTRKRTLTLGWNEWLALPELAIPAIRAKIDTGAKTSAIHASQITPFMRDGQNWVRFTLQPLPRHKDLSRTCEAPILDKRTVISSNGQRENRYAIRTPIQIGEHQWHITLTLTSRESMSFRMLLGREAFTHNMRIDPKHSRLLGQYTKADLLSLYSL